LDHPGCSKRLGASIVLVTTWISTGSWLRAVAAGFCVVMFEAGCAAEHGSIRTFVKVVQPERSELAAPWPPAIVPQPRDVRRLRGSMVFPAVVRISGSERAPEVASLLEAGLGSIGTRIESDTRIGTFQIRLLADAGDSRLGPEGYRLLVNSSGIGISANTDAGLFYGAQTLLQLATRDGVRPAAIPFVEIVDWPEYRWRGIHLDVSRHFFPKAVVEQFIDVAARFKLNTFHWHLTDDQGWRLEVPAYPNLTAIGGCRAATQIGGFGSRETDGVRTCAWYTEDDVREVVAFAKRRHVTVVPEIEGPGHSVEAMAAYSTLACKAGSYEPLVYWGSTKYSLCPSDATFAFYDVVFRELSELFPGPYVHIGGDEVPYWSWRSDPTVDALMRRRGLESYPEVEAYFTRRVQAIAKKYHRRIVGWNEIESSGVSSDAVVMAWTDREAGPAAARRGYDVVMVPGPPLYFDAYQSRSEGEPPAIGGLTTLEDVYDYDPSAGFDDPAARVHLLGAQGNLWTEYIPTREQLWYMAYPRALALSEVCWSPRSRMSWPGFVHRAGVALARLERLGVTFRVPPVTFAIRDHGAPIELADSVPNAEIWYSLDRETGSVSWTRYRAPLEVKAGVRVMAMATISGHRPSVVSSEIASELSDAGPDVPARTYR
jgi:hexosaminidase